MKKILPFINILDLKRGVQKNLPKIAQIQMLAFH